MKVALHVSVSRICLLQHIGYPWAVTCSVPHGDKGTSLNAGPDLSQLLLFSNKYLFPWKVEAEDCSLCTRYVGIGIYDVSEYCMKQLPFWISSMFVEWMISRFFYPLQFSCASRLNIWTLVCFLNLTSIFCAYKMFVYSNAVTYFGQF